MATLKNPQMQIPGGYDFLEPSTRWKPAPFSSLDSIVQQLISHRQGRPDLIAKNKWSLDRGVVMQEVMAYNVAKCQQMGWLEYITGSAEAVPFHSTPHRTLLQKVQAVAGGGKTVVEWLGKGADSVSPELSAKRGLICASCPRNVPGDWTSFFTVPVSQGILAALNLREQWKLSTPYDDKLNVCEVCLCPIKLKLHMPMTEIMSKMKPEVMEALPDFCWIKKQDA